MAIKFNDSDLKDRIVNALKEAKIEVPVGVDEGTGEIKKDKISLVGEPPEGQGVQFDNPKQPIYQKNYSSSSEAGIAKIAEAVAKEVLSYIAEYAEVTLKERLDALENDYNTLIIALNTAGSGLSTAPLTPVGTALTGVATAGGGITRALDTTQKLKLQNESTDIG